MASIGDLHTDRMRLRPHALDGVDLLMERNADPEAVRHLTGGAAPTRVEVGAGVRPRIESRWMAFEHGFRASVGRFGLDATGEDGYGLGTGCGALGARRALT